MRPSVLLALILLACGGIGWFAWSQLREGATHSDVQPAGPGGPSPSAAEPGVPPPAPAPPAGEKLSEDRNTPKATPAPPRPPAAPRIAAVRPPEPRPSLSGRIVDDAGAPVAGARVLVASKSRGPWPLGAKGPPGTQEPDRTLSQPDGRFELAQIDEGPLRLAVRRAGFAPLDRDDLLALPQQALEVGDLQLTPAIELAGRVVDEHSAGVAGAELFSLGSSLPVPARYAGSPHGERVAVAGEDGEFRIESLAPGEWRLLVCAADHPEAVFEGATSVDQSPSLDLELTLQAGFAIEGVVHCDGPLPRGLEVAAVPTRDLASRAPDVPFSSGSPAGTAPLESLAGFRRTPVDGLGGFVLRGLAAGERYTLRAFDPDVAVEPECALESRDRFSSSVEAVAGERDVELAYGLGATVNLTVVDHTNGLPIEEFSIGFGGVAPTEVLASLGQEHRRHPGGQVRIQGLRGRVELGSSGDDVSSAERFTIRVEAEGYEQLKVRGPVLEAGRSYEIGTLELWPLPVLRVLVLDSETGAPIEGAAVLARSENPLLPGRVQSSDATDERGLARLTLPACPLSLVRASHPGHAPAIAQAPREPPGPLEPPFELRLFPGASVSVDARDARGEPLPLARILHAADVIGLTPMQRDLLRSFETRALAADARGRAVFRDLQPGVHAFGLAVEGRLGSDATGSAPEMTEIILRAGETRTLELRAEALATLAGRVLRGSEPLAGARLQLARGKSFWSEEDDWTEFSGCLRGDTDEQGRFAFADLSPGVYSLIVSHERLRTRRVVAVERGSREILIDIDDTGLRGRVVDEEGRRVPGAKVQVFADRRGRRADFVLHPGWPFTTCAPDRTPIASALANSEGAFELLGLPSEVTCDLAAERGALSGSRAHVVIPSGRIVEGVEVEVERTGELSVEIDVPVGTTASCFGVYASCLDRPEALETIAQVPENQRAFVLGGLAAGRWVVGLYSLDRWRRVERLGVLQPVLLPPGKSQSVRLTWR
jgi:carboxypeptidase family protein